MDFDESDQSVEYSISENSDYEYFNYKFIGLDNIVQYLFDNGLLTDIECRTIVHMENFEEALVAIYSIICTRDLTAFKKILQVFRNKVHPLQDPKILWRIFSFLKYDDITNCGKVNENWKLIVDLLIKSKYDEISMNQLLLDTIVIKQKFILNPESDLGRIAEMQATVFILCLAMKPETDDTLHQLLQIKSEFQANAHDRQIDECYATDNPRVNLIPKVLSLHTVLNTVFKFLPLQDIKTCRIVCRNWYSTAESVLRKLSVVRFYPSVGIYNFNSVSKFTSQPITAFKLTGDFEMYELTEFFSKHGENVKFLDLFISKAIHSCLSLTPNLTELYLQGNLSQHTSATDCEMMIPFNKLYSIKSLRLSNTAINIVFDQEKQYQRIAPLKMSFNNVRFYIDGAYPAEVTFNTVLDFTKTKDVQIAGCSRQIQIFDWAKETFDAERMTFSNVRFVNMIKSKSAVDHLKLFCCEPFSEKASMSVKQLLFQDGTIKLSTLPESLEKLGINEMGRRGAIRLDVAEPFQLPNLVYLSFRKPNEFNLLSHFDNSHNLTELEMKSVNALDTRWLPRSVKKLKLETKSGLVNFVGGETRGLDILILHYIDTSRVKELNLVKIRPKVLVLQLRGYFSDKSIVSFLQKNKRIEKMYVQFIPPVTANTFDHSDFSRLVDKASGYYKFSDNRGKGITCKEFFTVKNSVDLLTTMNGFWNSDGVEHHKRHNDGTFVNDFHDESDSDDMSDNYTFADPDDIDEDYDELGDW